MMNIHHLELFYYVARYGGFTAASRSAPYPIQQPALSSQIKELQVDLGVELCIGKPFRLTPAGERLFTAISPFFASLDSIKREVRGESDNFVRFGAPETALRDHLPRVFSRVKKRLPHFRFALEGLDGHSVPASVEARQIDIGIGPDEKRRRKTIESEHLIDIPLVLLVPKRSRWLRASDILANAPGKEPLIALRLPDLGRVRFDEALAAQNLRYPDRIEVATLNLVVEYVRAGFGIGLAVRVGPATAPTGTRMLPLDDFPPVSYSIFWREPLSTAGNCMLAEIRSASKQLHSRKGNRANGR